MARSKRSTGLRTYWKTVHAVARRTDRSIAQARAIVREGRSRGLTHTALRKTGTRRASSLLSADASKTRARVRQTRERERQRELLQDYREAETPAERRAVAEELASEFPQTIVPEPEPLDLDDAPDAYEHIDDWIDYYDLYDEYDPPEDFDVTPDYKGKGK
jgi:hypothetical protein